ncbi:hypothetical protein DVH24_007784 [Malus domestica]|uniref:FBD domain-containing protein n=1 Tax=Malus domestica TaxID=3750 RepID=A0A498JNV8_MALDO|nr:hypothetical protein DVH24_007784 [Malus domestica]
MELDRISNVPSDVIRQILSGLPIKEAVKTNIVATSAIDHWIRHLSRNAIKELVLEILEGDTYKIPSCLFSYQYLVHLELNNCLLKPPFTFKGFGRLKVLCLDLVTVVQDVLDNLIVCCPLLERLTLTKCDGFNVMTLTKFFEYDGSFEHVSIMNTLNLAVVCINLVGDGLTWTLPLSSSYLVNFLAHLLHIRRLTIQSEFLAVMDYLPAHGCFSIFIESDASILLQYLADGDLPVKLPEPYMYLNFLSMSISFHISKEVSAAQCLLRSTPALQKLEIAAFDEDQSVEEEYILVNKILEFLLFLFISELFSNIDDNQDCLLTQLRLVKITNISGIKAELDFIEFLLSSSPVLEKTAVKPAFDDCSSDLLKNMILFRHASAHCEIIYLDP